MTVFPETVQRDCDLEAVMVMVAVCAVSETVTVVRPTVAVARDGEVKTVTVLAGLAEQLESVCVVVVVVVAGWSSTQEQNEDNLPPLGRKAVRGAGTAGVALVSRTSWQKEVTDGSS